MWDFDIFQSIILPKSSGEFLVCFSCRQGQGGSLYCEAYVQAEVAMTRWSVPKINKRKNEEIVTNSSSSDLSYNCSLNIMLFFSFPSSKSWFHFFHNLIWLQPILLPLYTLMNPSFNSVLARETKSNIGPGVSTGFTICHLKMEEILTCLRLRKQVTYSLLWNLEGDKDLHNFKRRKCTQLLAVQQSLWLNEKAVAHHLLKFWI